MFTFLACHFFSETKQIEKQRQLTRKNPPIEDVERNDRPVPRRRRHESGMIIDTEVVLEPQNSYAVVYRTRFRSLACCQWKP